MSTIISVIKRNPLVTFFVLAYLLSWGSYFILSGPFLFPFGSLVAALIVASITSGKDGLKDLLSRCLRWRVGFIWFAAALLVPVAIALVCISLNLLLGAPMPTADQFGPWYNILLFFPMSMTDAPLWEDSGWRGFALPKFPSNRSPLSNTLLLGLLLAGWHLPIAIFGGGYSLTAPYLIACVGSAVVTNWIYHHGGESALLAILYHTAANTMGLYFFSMFEGDDLIRLYWLLAIVNWIVAVLVILTGLSGRHQPREETRPVDL